MLHIRLNISLLVGRRNKTLVSRSGYNSNANRSYSSKVIRGTIYTFGLAAEAGAVLWTARAAGPATAATLAAQRANQNGLPEMVEGLLTPPGAAPQRPSGASLLTAEAQMAQGPAKTTTKEAAAILAAKESEEKAAKAALESIVKQIEENATCQCNQATMSAGKRTQGTRYVGEAEARIIERTGRVPNTNAAGEPKTVFYTHDKPLDSAAEAQAAYNLPQKPTHRVTVDTRNAQPGSAGNVENGTGIELMTDRSLPAKGSPKKLDE